VFADSSYWIALLNPDDELHGKACELSSQTSAAPIVTSDDACRVAPRTSGQFKDAVRFFKLRNNKWWSLTDCSSILIMQTEGIQDVLTHDKHFVQAGFAALLRSAP